MKHQFTIAVITTKKPEISRLVLRIASHFRHVPRSCELNFD